MSALGRILFCEMRETELTTALQQYFGYSQFRPGQREIVSALTDGQDCLAIMPTGGGKSICFQLPGILRQGTVIVISPLISLMQDQVFQLEKRGVAAAFINSSLTSSEQRRRLRVFAKKGYRFVYLAPERLHDPQVLQAAQQAGVSLIVVDEAHCLSEWGHDFRPSYLQISTFISHISPRPPVGAFTATATPKTQQEIIKSLDLTNPYVSIGSFRRSNLRLIVHHCPSRVTKELQLVRLLKRYHNQSGIIYVATRIAAESLTQQLRNFHLFHKKIEAYHGGLDTSKRTAIQQRFITNQTPVIVATNAFGMGVDKPDIRWVIHAQPSSSVENYSQEVGRAGRDGQPADCHTLLLSADEQIVSELCQNSRQRQKYSVLLRLLHDDHQCRMQSLAAYFGENSEKCGQCDCCIPAQDWALPNERLIYALLSKQCHIYHHPFPIPYTTLKWLSLLQPTNHQSQIKVPGLGKGRESDHPMLLPD